MRNGYVLGAIFLVLLAPLVSAAQITQMSVHAPSVSQGSEVTLTYTLTDNQPLGRVTTDVFLPAGINHRDSQATRGDTYSHQQTFVLPHDYRSDDEILVRVQASNQAPITTRIPLQSRNMQVQATQQPRIVSETDIAIIVDPVRDVIPGDSVYYRAQVYNTGQQAIPVTLGISDVGSWATYRVDPSPTQILRAGESEDFYVYLSVDDDAHPGTKYFNVTATHQDLQESAGVRLAVLQPLQTQTSTNYGPWIIAAAIILVVLALAILIANYYRNDNKPRKLEEEEDDFITYY